MQQNTSITRTHKIFTFNQKQRKQNKTFKQTNKQANRKTNMAARDTGVAYLITN